MSHISKKWVLAVAAAGVLSSGIAVAQDAANEKHAHWATKVRQSVFTLLGHNMGPIGGMLRGKVPYNAEVVESKAKNINQLANMIADVSRVNTSKFKVETEALDKIWAQPDDYAKKIQALVMASENVLKIVKTGSEADVKKAMGQIGRACGSCHDDFKVD